MKTGTDTDARLVNPRAVVRASIEDLVELETPDNLPQRERVQPVETTVYEVTAILTAYKWENNPRTGDNDYHLVLEDDDGRTLIAEIPAPVCVGDSSPFHDAIHEARDAFDHELTATGRFQTANIAVRVVGVGFFDFAHGQRGAAPNGFELHPLLEIEFADPFSGLAERPLPAAPEAVVEAPAGPGCSPLPLPHMGDIMAARPIDAACGASGDVDPGDPKALQNQAKNNLCAAGTPALVTAFSFRQLQRATDQRGVTGMPEPRDVLRDIRVTTENETIGEGTLVHYVAFVQKAKYSNVGSGESVNCHLPDKTENDMHIALTKTPTEESECASTTAEMIPHFRPEAWTPENFHHLSLFKPSGGHHPYLDYDTSARPLVRLTGQLFFDASHKVCRNGVPTSGNPARFSNWEVHPVYALDVCVAPNPQSRTACDPDNEAVWMPLDQWVEQERE